MKSADPTNPTLWSRILAALKKIDTSFPLISPFSVRPNGPAYHLFLNGRTILIERPAKSKSKDQARHSTPTA